MPKNRTHRMLGRAMWGNSRVRQEGRGEDMTQSFYLGFHGIKWTRQGRYTV